MSIEGTELLGYAASLIVVLALTMTSVVRLRVLSLCGSITFFVYGLLIDSVPIMLTNASIATINVWFLRKEFRTGGVDLGVSRIRADSPFLLDFIAFHSADIGRFQPDFAMPVGDDVIALLLTRDGLPAGTLIGRRDGDVFHVDLDYVLTAFRDSRLGGWLYTDGARVFRDLGITELRAEAATDTHARYLQRMGFRIGPSGDAQHHSDSLVLRL
jgi:hypothetical protein